MTTEIPIRVAQIDVRWCPKGVEVACFSEEAFKGSLEAITREALSCIQNNYLYQTVIKHSDRAEASRFWNFPFAAIEAALLYAANHLPGETNATIEVRIGYHELTIKSSFEPDLSIQLNDGRATDTSKIFKAMAANGYPAPMVEAAKDCALLLIRLPAHALVQEPFPQAIRSGPP